MRNLILLFMSLLLLALVGFAESYRRTTSDMYMDSYMAMMRSRTRASVAEIRADQYRSMYEVCDEHHNCTNVTAGMPERPVEKTPNEDPTETVKPFAHVPIWM